MNEQLNHAYDLIKQGKIQEAIDIIEPIIRSDRNNEDAWWLLANATEDIDAKRNALNNVLQITENESRKNKAETLLRQLDDPFDFDIPATNTVGMSEYVAIDDVPKKSSGRFNCATISLIIVGLIGACGLFGCFAIYNFVGDEMFDILSIPEIYDNLGTLENNETYTDDISSSQPIDGYFYSGELGEELQITLTTNAEVAPFITIYDINNSALIAISQTRSFDGNASLSYQLAEDGDFLIAIRGLELLGSEVGFGDYELEFEVR